MRASLIVRAFLLVGLAAMATSGAAANRSEGLRSQVSLKWQGSDLFLLRGGHRLLLMHGDRIMFGSYDDAARPPLDVPLPGGYRVRMDAGKVVSLHGGRETGSIALDALAKQWLASDTRWGTHSTANEMRYFYGGCAFTNACSNGDSVYALLNWFGAASSYRPIRHQHLVRIRVRPTLKVDALRLLDMTNYAMVYHPPVYSAMVIGLPRLFEVASELVLFDRSRFEEIDPAGKMRRVIARVPSALIPVGFVNQRWGLLAAPPHRAPRLPGRPTPSVAQALWCLDLRAARKPTPLPGRWDDGPWAQHMVVPSEGTRVAYNIETYSTDGHGHASNFSTTSIIVRVPDGKRVLVPGKSDSHILAVWRGMLVRIEDATRETIGCYDVASGRLLKRMPSGIRAHAKH